MTRLERIAHAGDALFGIAFLGMLVAALLDLTVLDGRIPNTVLWAIAGVVGVWFAINAGRHERERMDALKQAASSLGLEWISDDSSGLPEEVSYKIRPGDRAAVRNVMTGSVGGRRVVLFETAVLEERRWWDDEPSIEELSCCWMKLEGELGRFHVEVGSGMKRLREGWPEPNIDLSIDRRAIRASSIPGAIHDVMYGKDMRTHLARVTHPCHIRVNRDAVLLSTWRSLGASRQIVDDLTGFVDRLHPVRLSNPAPPNAAEMPPHKQAP